MTTTDDPIRFAERLLALLEEGSFTATYKFAVLLGLMDLCLEHSNRFGEPAPMVTTRQLAEKVIDLYWSHTTPFETIDGEVLKQNSGKPAVILSRIQSFRNDAAPDLGCTLHRARLTSPIEFQALLDEVEWTLVLMPLPETSAFRWSRSQVHLEIEMGRQHQTEPVQEHPRVRQSHLVRRRRRTATSVRLAPLLRPLMQTEVGRDGRQTQSTSRLPELESFLFGAGRVSLQPVRAPLLELQRGTCFYCGGRVQIIERTWTTSSPGLVTQTIASTTLSSPTPRATGRRRTSSPARTISQAGCNVSQTSTLILIRSPPQSIGRATPPEASAWSVAPTSNSPTA